MMSKMLFVDPEKCTGCRLCETACALHQEKACNPAKARLHVAKWETAGMYIPIVCLQCENPICETVCPLRALKRDPGTGAMLVDDDLCVGCRLCVQFCPFGGVEIDTDTRKVRKCDLCGGEPVCVAFCEPRALQYVDDSTVNRIKRRAAAERYSEFMKKLLATTE